MYSNGPPHMAEQKQDDQLEHTYSIYVRIRDVTLNTCQRRWTIGISGERGSGISVLAARHDDDDDDIYIYINFQWEFNSIIKIGEESASTKSLLTSRNFLTGKISENVVWNRLNSMHNYRFSCYTRHRVVAM